MYIKGTINRVEDVFSQRPHVFLVIPLEINLRENILALQIDDDWFKEVKVNIEIDTMMIPRYERYSLDSDRLLIYNNIIYVPPNDELRRLILNEAHRAMYMDHP
jgi:hypothetical protein